MEEDLDIFEDTIKRLMEDKGFYEPDIGDYEAEQMRSYYFKKQQYKRRFEMYQDEIRNGRIKFEN